MSEKPSSLETISSPAIVLSIASSIDPRRPAANTATNETSASPIISAAAVEAVRAGLRIAFSRARRPGIPRSFSSGTPTSEARGVTSLGLSSATPSRTAAAPIPTQASAGERASKRPTTIRPRPAAIRQIAAIVRARRSRVVAGTAPSRRPATGGTRVARSAGKNAATTVSPVPSSSPTITVRAAITVPVLGRSMPSALNSELIRGPNPIPARTPRIAAPSPIANASITTEERIWRRFAPSVRSIANSRVRWATVIENVLKIRKAATNRATPAKINSAVFRKPMNWPTSSRWDCTFSAPVFASSECGSAAVRLAARRSGVVPGSAATWIWSSRPCLAVIRCASGRVNSASVAPPNESTLPSVAIPDTVYSPVAPLPAISIRSPTANPSSSAEALSITTSSAVVGLWPST